MTRWRWSKAPAPESSRGTCTTAVRTLIPLNDLEEVREFEREWIGGLKSIDGKKETDEDQLYVLNINNGDFKRVFGFKQEKNLTDRLLKAVG
jgi:hypothetical protein